MAFGDVVGTPAENNAGSASSLTVTFGAATSGNLLVAVFVRNIAATWTTVPSNWNEGPQVTNASGNFAAKVFWKISTGGETSVVGTTSASGGNWRGVVAEFAGAFEASPLDQFTDNETNIATAVTSQASGTTGTTSQADELAIACFAAQVFSNADTSRAYSNSFTEVIAGGSTNSGRAGAYIARRVLSATGTYSCAFSVTDTGDEMYGAILTFKKQVSGSTHDLTATGVALGTPSVDSPAAGLTVGLSSNGVTEGTPGVDSPALSIAHSLVVVGVELGTPSVGTSVVDVAHGITATGVDAGTPATGTPAIVQAFGMVGADVDLGTPVVAGPALSVAHALVAVGIATGTPTVGSPAELAQPMYVITIPAQSRRVTVEGQSRIVSVARDNRRVVVVGE